MNTKKLDFRVNLGVDKDFEQALDAARTSRRMTKTGFIRETLLSELRRTGFMPKATAKGAGR